MSNFFLLFFLHSSLCGNIFMLRTCVHYGLLSLLDAVIFNNISAAAADDDATATAAAACQWQHTQVLLMLRPMCFKKLSTFDFVLLNEIYNKNLLTCIKVNCQAIGGELNCLWKKIPFSILQE